MDHVWDKYLAEHKGNQPRNAFDLLNFSRSTDATLNYPDAKILFAQKSNNSSAITLTSFNSKDKDDDDTSSSDSDNDSNKPNIDTPRRHSHRQQIPNDNNDGSDDDDDEEPEILKSPKRSNTNSNNTNSNNKKRKFSRQNTNTSRRTSRQHSRHSKHSKSGSKDSLLSKHSKTNSKSSKNKFGVDSMKFNLDEILKEDNNIDNNISDDLRNIYKSDSLDNKLTDFDITLNENDDDDDDEDLNVKIIDIPNGIKDSDDSTTSSSSDDQIGKMDIHNDDNNNKQRISSRKKTRYSRGKTASSPVSLSINKLKLQKSRSTNQVSTNSSNNNKIRKNSGYRKRGNSGSRVRTNSNSYNHHNRDSNKERNNSGSMYKIKEDREMTQNMDTNNNNNKSKQTRKQSILQSRSRSNSNKSKSPKSHSRKSSIKTGIDKINKIKEKLKSRTRLHKSQQLQVNNNNNKDNKDKDKPKKRESRNSHSHKRSKGHINLSKLSSTNGRTKSISKNRKESGGLRMNDLRKIKTKSAHSSKRNSRNNSRNSMDSDDTDSDSDSDSSSTSSSKSDGAESDISNSSSSSNTSSSSSILTPRARSHRNQRNNQRSRPKKPSSARRDTRNTNRNKQSFKRNKFSQIEVIDNNDSNDELDGLQQQQGLKLSQSRSNDGPSINSNKHKRNQSEKPQSRHRDRNRNDNRDRRKNSRQHQSNIHLSNLRPSVAKKERSLRIKVNENESPRTPIKSTKNEKYKSSKNIHDKNIRKHRNKPQRSSSADPRSIMNDKERKNKDKEKDGDRPRRKKKPPPSKNMRKHRGSNELNAISREHRRKSSKSDNKRHQSNQYHSHSRSPRHRPKEKKSRANSDYLQDYTERGRSSPTSPVNHKRAGTNNTYKLGRIHSGSKLTKNKDRKERKKSHSRKRTGSESINHEYNATEGPLHGKKSQSVALSQSSGQSSPRKTRHKPFRIGDVVEVSLKIGDTKKTDLARVRYYGLTCLDSQNKMYGIECFKFQFNSHKIGGRLVNDGSINGRKKLFMVKKPGYGTFIKPKGIRSKKSLWNLKKSKNALKLDVFEPQIFINAAKYGSVKVVKHLFKLLLIMSSEESKKSSPRGRKKNFRSGSNGFYRNSNPNNLSDNIPQSTMQTIQTGFGYAVLNNHTKIIKIILTHCGSNNIQKYNPRRNTISGSINKKRHPTSKSMNHLTHSGLTEFLTPINTDNKDKSGNSSSSSSSADDDDDNDDGDDVLTDDEEDSHDDDDDLDDLDDNNDEDDSIMDQFNKLALIQNGGSKFYSSDLFDLVCEQKNFKMLRLLIQYDSWPLLSPNSRGLHGIFCKKGYLKWIKYLSHLFPYITNMPLIQNDVNSTMIHTSIIYERIDYVKYMLNSNFQIELEFDKYVDETQEQITLPIPILLLTIMNINIKNVQSTIEIIRLLLLKGANINWFPKITLKQQQHLLTQNNQDNDDDIEFDFDPEYHEHKLMYYSFQHPNQMKIPEIISKKNKDKDDNKLDVEGGNKREQIIPQHPKTMVLGSILAALCYKFVECYKQVLYQINKNPKYNKKYALEQLSEILSLFMLYGIDFEGNEFQHVWMEYNNFSFRWIINNFPYNVCSAKDQFIFLQKCFKKSLKKYPVKLLSEIQNIFDNEYLYWFDDDLSLYIDELIDIFEQYIIPYSIYDALIFESLHYYAPYTPEVSSPESADFMFAYQRSPIVE